MPKSLAFSDKLIEEARRIGRHKTRQAAITAALEEYVKGHRRQRIFKLFGAVDYHPNYDYKAARRRAG